MQTIYEVVPGKSIGPFALGMTRREIESLELPPLEPGKPGESLFFPLIDLKDAEPDRFKHGPYPGLTVEFDGNDRCRRLLGVFGWEPKPPYFSLRGELLNGMTAERADELERIIGGGVQMSVFERGDPHIMSVWVAPLPLERRNQEI